ncbi:MAG: peptide deformylase [Myxococcales bacterium]|nr:peptide deformylase [Myxococcales bacterium]
MAVLPIRLIGDPVLRTVCRRLSLDELRSEDVQEFIDDLIETMRDANGAGLAAPQVGRAVAIAAVQIADNPRYPYKPNFPLTVFVNPTVTAIGHETESLYEGCLSVPNLRGLVSRSMHVHIDALDRHGHSITLDVHGLTAGTFQHEFDHLEGRLFVDRVEDSSTFCTWDNFDRFHKTAFVQRAESIVQQYGG